MRRELLSGLTLIAVAGLSASYFATTTNADRSTESAAANDDEGSLQGGTNPDVIVGAMNGSSNWVSNSGKAAYSFGTTSCNIGTSPLEWIDEGGDDRYPVIGQNMFKLTTDGRFEQIGQGWLKHAFCALQGTLCGSCTPYCGGCCDHLGVGCSDPYGSGLNGTQSGLGTKTTVNPHTGAHSNNPGGGPINDAFSRRVVVQHADLDPTMNPGALYYMEGQYVTLDDSAAGHQDNNASYRQLLVGGAPNYSTTPVGPTVQQDPAIRAWKANDPTVTIREIKVSEIGDGKSQMLLGYKVTDNGDGTWNYEYAVQNLNSERGAKTFRVPLGENVDLTDIGFRDVDYHSGDSYDMTDWAVDETATQIEWATVNPANVNANALRWGTLYNYRFVANTGPQNVTIEMDMFKDGDPEDADTVFIQGVGPSPAMVVECPSDTNGDGVVDVQDMTAVILAWDTADPAADVNDDGIVDVSDLTQIVLDWGDCP